MPWRRKKPGYGIDYEWYTGACFHLNEVGFQQPLTEQCYQLKNANIVEYTIWYNQHRIIKEVADGLN